jgi:hypothetical protein
MRTWWMGIGEGRVMMGRMGGGPFPERRNILDQGGSGTNLFADAGEGGIGEVGTEC